MTRPLPSRALRMCSYFLLIDIFLTPNLGRKLLIVFCLCILVLGYTLFAFCLGFTRYFEIIQKVKLTKIIFTFKMVYFIYKYSTKYVQIKFKICLFWFQLFFDIRLMIIYCADVLSTLNALCSKYVWQRFEVLVSAEVCNN